MYELISKSVCIHKLGQRVNEYNNTFNTIKMIAVDIKPSTYTDFNVKNKNKDPKSEVDDHVRISKYKIIFTKCYIPNFSGEDFVIKKVENTVPRTYVISDLNGEKIVRTFYEINCKRQIKKGLELKK